MVRKKSSPSKVASPRVACEPNTEPVKSSRRKAHLETENVALREQIRAIEARLAHLEAALPKERLIILRDISKEEAEKEILRLFSQGGILYYSDIAEELRLDLKTVVEICNELESRGEIEEVDNAVQ